MSEDHAGTAPTELYRSPRFGCFEVMVERSAEGPYCTLQSGNGPLALSYMVTELPHRSLMFHSGLWQMLAAVSGAADEPPYTTPVRLFFDETRRWQFNGWYAPADGTVLVRPIPDATWRTFLAQWRDAASLAVLQPDGDIITSLPLDGLAAALDDLGACIRRWLPEQAAGDGCA